MTDQGRKEAITKQVRMVRYREQSVRDCVDNIESMIEALKQGQTLPIDSVVRQSEQLKGFVDWFNKTDKTQSILNERVNEYIETLKLPTTTDKEN